MLEVVQDAEVGRLLSSDIARYRCCFRMEAVRTESGEVRDKAGGRCRQTLRSSLFQIIAEVEDDFPPRKKG